MFSEKDVLKNFAIFMQACNSIIKGNSFTFFDFLFMTCLFMSALNFFVIFLLFFMASSIVMIDVPLILWKKLLPNGTLCAICTICKIQKTWKTPEEDCNFTKKNTPPWVFSRFLNCANGTKSRKASQMYLIWVSKILKRSENSCYEDMLCLKKSE